jgi:UDP-N-acetylmuramate dehydrogenase
MDIEFPAKFDIATDVSLAELTSVGVGGPARYLAEVASRDFLIDLYRDCKRYGIRFLLLGHGTNIFFADSGFDGLVAVLRYGRLEKRSDTVLYADSGVRLEDLTRMCLANGLTGCEFSSGIPGSIGGAIYGNAGAYGRSIADCLVGAEVLEENGVVKEVDNGYFRFQYRDSVLKRNSAIVLSALFEFERGDPGAIREQMQEILSKRREKLPSSTVATAGSYFKNLKDEQGRPIAAARYLDAVGSKETRINDAAVYHKHANIFVNRGRATAADLLELERVLRTRVFEKFGVLLEREVIYVE